MGGWVVERERGWIGGLWMGGKGEGDGVVKVEGRGGGVEEWIEGRKRAVG